MEDTFDYSRRNVLEPDVVDAPTRPPEPVISGAYVDLEDLSIDGLVILRDRVLHKLQDRVEARQEELRAENERLSALTPSTGPVAVLKAKYAHPHDKGKTWGGRGSKPKWVEDWLAGGGTLEELRGAA